MKKYLIVMLTLCLSFSVSFAKDKEPDGLKFSQIKAGGLYDKLGLKNDDILLKIDGKPAKDVAELRTAFERLGKGGGLKLEIYRKGKIETLKYDFKP